MNKKIDYSVLNKAYNSAPLNENLNSSNIIKDSKKKLINIPIEWENKIKKNYKGTINSYILIAIYERMQKDGVI